jgi:hypothetical protein
MAKASTAGVTGMVEHCAGGVEMTMSVQNVRKYSVASASVRDELT